MRQEAAAGMAEIGVLDKSTEADEHSWAKTTVAAWLADHRGGAVSANELFTGFCEHLVENGLPLFRVSLSLQDSHPQIAARGFFWVREKGTEVVAYDFTDKITPAYTDSPIRVINEGAGGLRCHLTGPNAQLDYPVLEELKAAGSTDFVAMPLCFSDGSRHYVSLTTDRPEGFHTRELKYLDQLIPLFSLRIEIEHARYTARTLMQTYLGHQAARRVTNGLIRRGEGESIEAIVLFADMRGFTRLVELHTPEDVVDTLSIYYEALAGPVEEFGGDIVKMMGDGLLVIFPVAQGQPKEATDHTACGAVAAVKRSIANLNSIDPDTLPEGVEHIRAGFALHYGQITFGNIGSLDRLDFTVIGPAVNQAVRAEQLTKQLQLPLVTTSAFADLHCTVKLRSLGFHVLRGVPEPVEIFTLEENLEGRYQSSVSEPS